MNKPQGRIPRNVLVLGSLAALMVMSGFVLYVWGYRSHDSAMREHGLLVEMVGVFFTLRASAIRARFRRAQSADGGERPVPTAAGRANRTMRIIGIALVLLGVGLFAAGPFTHSWTPRGYGLLAAFGGILLLRMSAGHFLSASPAKGGEEAVPKVARQFDRIMRITGIALVPLMALSTVVLFSTPPTSHEVWPLYTFFVVGLACTFVWAYLFAKFFVRLAVGGRGRW